VQVVRPDRFGRLGVNEGVDELDEEESWFAERVGADEERKSA
jgi:hypothetical protein